ncbi:uncharacterized protein Z519_05475 [Cladophialophora bantiana CBS 173.52]|uniref:NWD NACHT-NTPase N-terminal domain-containing protein n=1 Tax=Cladophialophora bantiana (strain ATCC 10958 / CBS 173.52 / CDC B-1940 / NIH 8579) TaxID=1442370 RepID=A0A0D2IBG0_CLAB1|nr:uncharacterized protein Z519_05475 [Cladophialophora bantiana CBS 173.52]KIW94159.1 hypothetical protein Z519_05475 [Cladophialophora bantiana CBS 173.52]
MGKRDRLKSFLNLDKIDSRNNQSAGGQTLVPVNPTWTAPQPTTTNSSRLSSWAEAALRLQNKNPEMHEVLMKIRGINEDDPVKLTELVNARRQESKRISFPVEGAIRQILEFEDIGTAATDFDPYRISPVVWRGFCLVLQYIVHDSALLTENWKHLEELTSKIRYWANFECLFLRRSATTFNDFKPLKEK